MLSTLEIAYSKAFEDAAGKGPHANFAVDILGPTKLLTELLPEETEVLALAALVRYAEARRPARLDHSGTMVPLSEQDPTLWNRELVQAADIFWSKALALGAPGSRFIQASIHRTWCGRKLQSDPAPWAEVLGLYDQLLEVRDDDVIRLNRAVALAEVHGVDAALKEIEAIKCDRLNSFIPYRAVEAEMLKRSGRREEAVEAYEAILVLGVPSAEDDWIRKQIADVSRGISSKPQKIH